MKLRDYIWFHNVRGLHAKGPYTPLDPVRYTRPQLGWAKLLVGEREHLEAVRALVNNHCMPIIRVFRENITATPIPDQWYDTIYRPYLEAGAYWFEVYDAPNDPTTWPQERDGSPQVEIHHENIDGAIAPLMDHWLDWAERIVMLGGYPAFPSLKAQVEPALATLPWADAMLSYLVTYHESRFMHIIARGLWFAVQPRVENRFYQQPMDGPRHVARPYHQVSSGGGGWHFEHPYDPIQQSVDRGRTVHGGTAETPHGAPLGLIAVPQLLQDLLKQHAGAGPVPVVATSGGITPVLTPGDKPLQPHPAYPPLSHESHTEATEAMFDWLTRKGPPWFWGMTLSTEVDYYDVRGTHPLITRWVNSPHPEKHVPDIDTGGKVRSPRIPDPPKLDLAPPIIGPLPSPDRVEDTGDTEEIVMTEEEIKALRQSDADRPDTDPIDHDLHDTMLLDEVRWVATDNSIVYEDDSLLDLVSVPLELPPGEEPTPDMNLVDVLPVTTISLDPDFIDPLAYAEDPDAWDFTPSDMVFAPIDRPDTESLLPSMDLDGEPAGEAFWQWLDDDIEVNDEPDDGLTALDRFDWLISSDGASTHTLPDDERDAPDFFDIVEEFTGERPYAVTEPLHFLLFVGPTADWFFTAALPYWRAFRPTVITDAGILAEVNAPLKVTVICPADNRFHTSAHLTELAPDAELDMICTDHPQTVLAELNRRVKVNQPFG